MTIKGELKDIKLADIFQMVAMQQQEGTLVVSDGETKKWLYFSSEGVSLLSSGKRRPTPLGQMLVRAGKITEKQLDEALAVWRRTGKRLGEVLCDFGLTTPEEIETVVQEQIAEEIYDLLDWQGTTFEFIPGAPHEEFTQARGDRRDLKFDVNAILLEAARRADEWEKVEREIGSINEIFVRSNLKGASANLEGDALSVYPLIDGSRTVHDIIAALRLPKTDVGRVVLALLEVGLIRPATREEIMRLTNQPAIEERGDRLARLMELALMRQEDIELRGRLAKVYEDLGRSLDASRHLAHLAGIYTEQYKLAEAAEALREAARLAPEDVETREKLVEIYIRLTNVPHAVLHLKRLAKQHTDNRAQAKALACYRRALELAPDDFECRRQVADMLIEIKDVDTALDECIKLEESARTQSERQEVRERYGRLLALAPNLIEARKRLAGLTEVERQKVRSRRATIRTAVIACIGVVLLVVGGTVLYLRHRHWQEKKARVDQLSREGQFDEAEKQLADDTSEKAKRLKEQIQAKREKEKTERQNLLRAKENDARMCERSGRLAAAAKIYRDLSEDLADSNAWKAMDLKEKARKLEEMWQYGVDEKHAGEELLRVGQCREAHEHFLRMVQRSSDLSRALGVVLPIRLTSIPAGATISVDGLPSGETPKTIYKQPGSPITIVFEKSGHETVKRSVLDDAQWSVDVTLPRFQRWTFATRGAVEAGAVFQDGLVFVGSRDGVLYAVDGPKGSEKWRFTASDDIMTTPRIAGGAVFFGTSDGAFYAVDLQTHKPKWIRKVSGFIRAAPALVQVGGKWIAVVGTSDTNVLAVDAATGKDLWVYPASQAVETSPSVSDGVVFVADDGGAVHAVQLGDGRGVWRFQANSAVYTSPLVKNGMVFVGSEQGTVYALDARKGGTAWNRVCGKIHVSLCADDARLYVGCEDNTLYALDLKTGEPKWRFAAASPITSPPVVDGGIVYVGSANGGFFAVGAADGVLRWKAAAEKAVRAPAGLSPQAVFVGADDCRVYAFER